MRCVDLAFLPPGSRREQHSDLHGVFGAFLPPGRRQGLPSFPTAWYQSGFSYLLVVDGVPGQVGEVHKLHVQRPELSQDTAACRRPAPVTTHPTEGGRQGGRGGGTG